MNLWKPGAGTMKASRSGIYYSALLLLLGAIVYLPGLGSDAIITQGDITMHVGLIRESLAKGAILVPELYGLPNGFKPPFLFWTGMFSDYLFGVSPWAERLPSAFFLIASAFVVFKTLIRFGQQREVAFLISGAFLLSSGAYKFSRLVLMEPSLAFFITLTFAFLLKHPYFHRDSREAGEEATGRLPVGSILSAGVIVGISGLIKGPLSLVYGGILFSVFGLYRILDFDFSRNGWVGKKEIPGVLFEGILFTFAAIVPLSLWSGAVYFLVPGGEQALRFFYGVENLGKFGAENQSSLRIFQGLVLYTFPWGILLFFAFVNGIRDKSDSGVNKAVHVILFSVLFFLLLHMLPNRKADYYIIPFLPVLFLAAGLVKKSVKPSPRFAISVTWIMLGLGWLATEGFLLYVEFKSVDIVTLIHLTIGGFFIGGGLFRPFFETGEQKEGRNVGVMLLSGTGLFYLLLQFFTLPLIARPLVPEEARLQIDKGLCVYDADSSQLTRIAIHIPGKKLKAVERENIQICKTEGFPLLVPDMSLKTEEVCPDCKLLHQWYIWNEELSPAEMLHRTGAEDEEDHRFIKFTLYDTSSYSIQEKDQ